MDSKNTHAQQPVSSLGPMIIIASLFFIFGFATWLNSLLIPYLRIACQLNEAQSYLVTFAFYIAYLLMAPISTRVLQRFGFKKGMAVALVIMAIGALLFIPAAYTRTYLLFLIGLFTLGGGLAILQTASNPYITIIGSVETAARRMSIMGICNKIAGALAPILLGLFLQLEEADKIAKDIATIPADQYQTALDAIARQVIRPYLGITAVLLLLSLWIAQAKLPEVQGNEEESTDHHSLSSHKKSLWDFPHVILGFIALFFYVGVEVLAGDTIIAYGVSQNIPLHRATVFTGYTMGAMILGYLIGIVTIPKWISQENAMKGCAVLGIIFTLGIVFTQGMLSLSFVALLGLANSLVWPALWPLALKGVGKFTHAASGLLVMGIAGGAIIPLLYGQLAHVVGSHKAYWLALPCYLFILYYGILGHKAGKN